MPMAMPTMINFFIIISFVLLFFSSDAAVLDPRDYLALQSIRASLRDLPGSTFFSTWDFTADPCSTFSGLLCSGGRVVSLSLGDPRAGSPGLTGLLPSSLSRLSALSDLSLIPGRVYGPIPPSLSLLSSLRFLALSHNYLSGQIPPSLFTSLRYLRTLDLSFNLISGQIPSHIPSSISTLILCHNRLTGKIPNFLSPSALIHLDLKRNNLTGPIPALPPSLKYLSLSSNQLYASIDQTISKLHNLNYIDLSMNRLTGSIPGSIFSFPINSIYLQRNQFTGPVRVAGTVMNARIVDLSYNRLSGLVPVGLAGAERIYLNFNGFTGRVPATYVERVRRGMIKVLYLQHNYLSGMDVVGFVVPKSVLLCLNFNCMVPPEGNVCPVRAGGWKSRPAAECKGWKEKKKGSDG